MTDDELREYVENAWRNLRRQTRHLGLADERCPNCGGPIETLLNSEGRNPTRCCWKCRFEVEEIAAAGGCYE